MDPHDDSGETLLGGQTWERFVHCVQSTPQTLGLYSTLLARSALGLQTVPTAQDHSGDNFSKGWNNTLYGREVLLALQKTWSIFLSEWQQRHHNKYEPRTVRALCLIKL